MKKAYIVKDYNSVWGVQNRVEALVDWSMNSKNVPYEIDINGDNALITVDDSKRSAYESDFEYNSDMQLFDKFMKDIQDPIFNDDVSIASYNESTSTPDNTSTFEKVALESCSSLGVDILRGFGLNLPEVNEVSVEEMSPLSRAQEAVALADKLDSVSNESLDFTVDHIPQYDSETDTLDGEEPLERPKEINIVTPAEVVSEAAKLPIINSDELSDYPVPDDEEAKDIPDAVPEVVKLIKSDEVDPKDEFVNEFINILKEFDMTPKTFVTAMMAIKALANNAAKAKDPDVTPEDVTGSEDYSYTNAVPYVQNPNEKSEPEIETQSVNVPEGEPNSEIGTESLIKDGLLRIFKGSSKEISTNTKDLDKAVEDIDKRIKVMLPKFEEAVVQLYSEIPGLKKDYPSMFKTDYKIVKMHNRIQFRIIEVDKSSRFKYNTTIFVVGLLMSALLGAVLAPADPSIATAAGLGAGIGASNAMTHTHELGMKLATNAVIDEQMASRLKHLTKSYKAGLISDYIGIELELFTSNGIGAESINADDLYASLINEDVPSVEGFELPENTEFTQTSLEAFWAKHPKRRNDNEVLADLKKICEDAKEIAIKALRELKERNAEIFEKYGAFVKTILDIKDIIFMDKHYIKLEIAKFELSKANKEVVPDTTKESIVKTLGGIAVSVITKSVLGPFASLATPSENSPSNYLLFVANQLRDVMEKQLKANIRQHHGAVTLVEDDIKGSMILTLAFKPLEMSNESIEADEKSLIEQLAMESSSDDEFFDKLMVNFENLSKQDVREATKYNMWHYYRTGERILCDPALSGKRLCEFIKK